MKFRFGIHSLKKKLLLSILVISTAFTAVVTFLSLYFDYREDLAKLEVKMAYVKRSAQKVIAHSMWSYNVEMIQVELDNIRSIRDVLAVGVYGVKGEHLYGDHTKQENGEELAELSAHFPLQFVDRYHQIDEPLGEIHVLYTKKLIIDGIKKRLITFFLMQLVKTFIISLILLYLFSIFITNDLLKIQKIFRSFRTIDDAEEAKNSLAAVSNRDDEIGELTEKLSTVLELVMREHSKAVNLKEVAEKANQSKDLFIASISHELRTPLNSISGMNEMLRMQDHTDQSKEFLDVQNKACSLLGNLIDDLLDIVKINVGQFSLNRSKFSFSDIVQECYDLLKPTLDERKNFLHIHISDEFPKYLWGDEKRIKQVLLNLFSNANRCTVQGSIRTHFTSVKWNDRIKVSFVVEDTGFAIEESELRSIFGFFNQGGNDHSHGSMGIGLSIVRQLVTLMGGDITVKSQVDQGTRFEIFFLLDEVVENTEEKVSQVSIDRKPIDRRLKILFVDDCDDNLFLLKSYMKNSIHDCHFFLNSVDAMREFKVESFDIIVTDIQMPVIDGYELARQVRRIEVEEKRSRCCIIALSAYSGHSYLEESQNAGCDLFLTKPIKRKQLLDSIETIVISIDDI